MALSVEVWDNDGKKTLVVTYAGDKPGDYARYAVGINSEEFSDVTEGLSKLVDRMKVDAGG